MRAAPAPDLRCCLLYQKLQLLDVCIQQSLQPGEAGLAGWGPRARRWDGHNTISCCAAHTWISAGMALLCTSGRCAAPNMQVHCHEEVLHCMLVQASQHHHKDEAHAQPPPCQFACCQLPVKYKSALCNVLLQAIRAYFGALQQQHSEQQGQEPALDQAGAEEDGWDGSEAAPLGDDGPTLGQQHSSHWYGHEAAQSERLSLPSGSGSPGREHDSMAGFSEQRQGSEPGHGFGGCQGSAPCQQQDSLALASSEDKQRQGSWTGLEQGSSAQRNSLREHYSDCLESLPGTPEGQAPTLQSPFADEGPQAGGQSPQLPGPTWDGLPAPAEGLAGSGSAAADGGDSGLSAPEGVAEVVPGQHLIAHPDRPLHIPITQASHTPQPVSPQ